MSRKPGSSCRAQTVDGSKWTDRKLCLLREEGVLGRKQQLLNWEYRDGDSDPLTPIELAINMSHLSTWKAFLASRKQYLCVFEYDVRVAKTFGTLLECIVSDEKANPFDVLHLINGNWAGTIGAQSKVTTGACPTPSGETTRLEIRRETTMCCAGASCYMLNMRFAEHLVDHMLPVRQPVDNFVGDQPLKRFRHYTLRTRQEERHCWTASEAGAMLCPLTHSTHQGPKQTVSSQRVRNLRC